MEYGEATDCSYLKTILTLELIMTINPKPTLETHILTTQEATNLIDWHYIYSPVKRYPLPTEVILNPGTGYTIERAGIENYVEWGSIWPSLSPESEMVGTKRSSTRNSYWVAQVFVDYGQDGHILYGLHGWLHIPTFHLDTLEKGSSPIYYSLLTLYNTIEEGVTAD